MSINAKTTSEQPSRREFLYYFGGASLALLGVTTCGLLARFVNPPVRFTPDDGIFLLSMNDIPPPDFAPVGHKDGQYWLVNTQQGALALYGFCTHGDYFLRWVPLNNRYECPGCGSKFKLDGSYIEGPAKRAMDRFVLQADTSAGLVTTPDDGAPILIDGAKSIVVNTRMKILGQAR